MRRRWQNHTLARARVYHSLVFGRFFYALVVTKPSLAQDFDEFTHRYSFFKVDASPNDKARNLHARACTSYTKFPYAGYLIFGRDGKGAWDISRGACVLVRASFGRFLICCVICLVICSYMCVVLLKISRQFKYFVKTCVRSLATLLNVLRCL